MGYLAKGIKNLWFAVQDIHPGELISAKAEKAFMQMRRQTNRQRQAGTGYVCGEGNIKNIMLIRRAECGVRQEAMSDNINIIRRRLVLFGEHAERSMFTKKMTVTTRSFTSYIHCTRLTSALLLLNTQSLETMFRCSLKVSFMNTVFCFQALPLTFLLVSILIV